MTQGAAIQTVTINGQPVAVEDLDTRDLLAAVLRELTAIRLTLAQGSRVYINPEDV